MGFSKPYINPIVMQAAIEAMNREIVQDERQPIEAWVDDDAIRLKSNKLTKAEKKRQKKERQRIRFCK